MFYKKILFLIYDKSKANFKSLNIFLENLNSVNVIKRYRIYLNNELEIYLHIIKLNPKKKYLKYKILKNT